MTIVREPKQIYASLKNKLRRLKKRIRPNPKVVPDQYAVTNHSPMSWQDVLAREGDRWAQAREAAKGGPRVLFATGISGADVSSSGETLLAVALTLRGAHVDFLQCDKALPGCPEAYIDAFPNNEEFLQFGPSKRICLTCVAHGNATYEPLGLCIHRYSNFLTPEDRAAARKLAHSIPVEQIPIYRIDDQSIGEHAYASTLRYFIKGNLATEEYGERVLRKFFESALIAHTMINRLLNQEHYDVLALFDGIYIPTGVVGEAGRAHKIHVVNWVPGYRTHCVIFTHDDPHHIALMNEPTSAWEDIDLTSELQQELMEYLSHRWSSKHNWLGPAMEQESRDDVKAIEQELGIDFSKPTVAMLTNLTWDGQVFYPSNAFPNIIDWAVQTIDYFATRPDLQLVIRVHPMEVRDTLVTREPILNEIARFIPEFPKNVFVIPPESAINTYVVVRECNAAIIYGTRTGIELTSMGIPVVVAGEAWVRNKGITLDAQTAQEYFQLLDQLPLQEKLSWEKTLRARKYAYHYYFRRMIPLPFLKPLKGYPPYKLEVTSLDDLLPGRDAGLDIICDGILHRGDFIYPAESHPLSLAPVAVAR